MKATEQLKENLASRVMGVVVRDISLTPIVRALLEISIIHHLGFICRVD